MRWLWLMNVMLLDLLELLGKGTLEAKGVMGRVDIITGTLGKALEVQWAVILQPKKKLLKFLRQRSRPYLFSNSLAPAIVGASIKVFELLRKRNFI
jgi:glycine C-acetyltransferase